MSIVRLCFTKGDKIRFLSHLESMGSGAVATDLVSAWAHFYRPSSRVDPFRNGAHPAQSSQSAVFFLCDSTFNERSCEERKIHCPSIYCSATDFIPV
mgnify:CR=1 FL=1